MAVLRWFFKITGVGIKRSFLLYRLAQLIGLPIIFLYFAFRCISDRSYWAFFGERIGLLPAAFDRTAPNSIWLHAVSVGEVVSAVPLIARLRRDRPNIPLYLSTSTVAGRHAANHHLSRQVDGIFYVPLDFGIIVRRVLRILRPAMLIVLETEIWPSLYHEAKRSGVTLLIVNGRISGRAWPRYRALRWFFRPLLRLPDLIFAQTEVDVQRYRALGVHESRLRLEGNLKYDAATALPRVETETFGAATVWIAASTAGPNEAGSVEKHSVDEDDIVLRVFRDLSDKFPRLLLVLAPRQPARFDVVAEKLQAAGIAFVRRSHPEGNLTLPGVLLLDTVGELAGWYPVADVAFVGGSLAPRGGHNILEPAAAGIPIVTGPHMQNFAAVAHDLKQSGALQQIATAEELEFAIEALLRDRQRAREMGAAGQATVQAKAGVAQRIAPTLWRLYHRTYPLKARSSIVCALYRVLSRHWLSGAARRRAQAERECACRPALRVPVISIGGVSAGGTGKTPLTNLIVRRLRSQGWQPGILTRGYRRRSTADYMVLGPGTQLPPAFTGDEAHIFLREAQAAVGIGADRYETAKLLLHHLPQTNVLVLDDGFQHAKMPRDVDILVLDGMDPWGGGAAVPLGRLREPLELLGHASLIVVTRVDDDHRYAAILERLDGIAPGIPVFRAHTNPLGWRDSATSQPVTEVGQGKAAAFCGLGNPANFWSTLDHLGINPVFRWTFPDHHHYRLQEVAGLLRSAEAHDVRWLLTTEKDCNNLPEGPPSPSQETRLVWLEIEFVIEDQDRFFEELLVRLRR